MDRDERLYTEEESAWAAQMAYCNFSDDVLNSICENNDISNDQLWVE